MKKVHLIALIFYVLLSYSLNSSELYKIQYDNYIEFDTKDITLYEERLYIINHLYNNPAFDLAVAEENGVFYISLSDNDSHHNLEASFNSFYENIIEDLKSISKEELGELFYEYKNNIPSELYHHVIVDLYDRDGENNYCSTALPFCTDNGLYMFPAGIDAGTGEGGPDYDCLSSTPNPAWYYMRIDNPGDIFIHMYSDPERDIDFCCWGPFDDPIEPCPNGLTQNKVVSCSYSTSYSETCVIPSSAQTGEYYILVITNYSNHPCNISFEKTSGNGTTDCSIMPPLINSNTPLCVGETLQLEAQDVSGASYHWTGPNGWTSSLRNPTRPNVTMDMSGTYSCDITVENQQSEPVTTEVDIFARATADFTNTTVCEGTPTQFTCTSSSVPSNNITSREWNFGDGSTGTGSNPSHTYLESGTYTVSLTVRTGGDCEDTKTRTVTVYNVPETDAGPDQTIDYGTSTTLNGTAGIGSYTYRWEPADMVVNPNEATTQTVQLTSSVLFTLTATSTQGDCTESDQVNVNVNGAALSASITTDNAVICDTESSQLNANAAGGTFSYTYSWSPTTGLDNPNISNPVFTPSAIDNPTQTYTYTCTINDGQTTVEPEISITVNKSYLNETIEDEVCQGYNNGSYQEYNFNINTMEYGTFSETKELKTISGCDSIVTLTLNIRPTYNDDFGPVDIYDEVCYSEETYNNYGFSINIHDIIIPEGSSYVIYEDTHQDVSQYGCDSITNLSLVVNKTYSEEYMSVIYDTIETCDESIIWGGTTLSETGDYEYLFSAVNTSCDSLVKLHYVRNDEVHENIKDTVCNSSDIQNSYQLYEWTFDYPGYYKGSRERFDENGCKMTVNYDLLLLNYFYVSDISDNSSEIVYYTGTGFDFYDYGIDAVTGGGTDEVFDGFTPVPETYEWSIEMINGESKWSCNNEGDNNTTVNISGHGAAYLYCDVTSLCDTIRRWILLYTPGYKPCEDADELSVNNIRSQSAELSWLSPADSCMLCYGTDENCTNTIITSQKRITIDNLETNTTYYWKVRSLCEESTIFIDGPQFITTSGVDVEENIFDDIALYPNPAQNTVNIKGENIRTIEIFNTMGYKTYINNDVHENHTTISTDYFNKGLYFVRIVLKDGKSGIKKLIIE